ncbi:M67 family metallopeptidase [Sandarakinorhabdus sp.]|jgi:proteasome lid subunit RPN8/RPN11|uniref:M67 family metallopeptidase n=1 Tax=Sandarakinorhabdus sp. TaxID=1916663 RepID=UPI0028A7EB4F|nr:M67 family metallopeptidase [Sandarakinorhabdus sp.]
MKLQISSGDRQFLLDAALASPQTEVCGLLLGQNKDGTNRVETLVPARNVAADPARSFEIDPATLMATHRAARGQGRQVIGHWHSHPNARREPSSRDAARATENGQIWLIIAGGDVTAWVPHAIGPGPATFQPIAIEVT